MDQLRTSKFTVAAPTRRGFVAGGAAFSAWAFAARPSFAGSRDPRFVFVILRGALDGLSAAAPVGDPDYEAARGGVGSKTGLEGRGIRLDDLFLLSANLDALGTLFRAKQALLVHAVATPYRERSHFDGQDVLESGQAGPGERASGWLGRALATLPRGDRVTPRPGFASGPAIPLLLRGKAEVMTWTPPGFGAPVIDTAQRLLTLYQHTDPMFAEMLQSGLDLDGLTRTGAAQAAAKGRYRDLSLTVQTAGRALAAPDGPRIGVLDLEGWDTHTQGDPFSGGFGAAMSGLDLTLALLHDSLGPAWDQTVVMVATEFGRTVAINGTGGTDHGTATVCFLVGGAVKGGRVIADWPGLKAGNLQDGRDLKPTTDLRAVAKGVLRDHLGFDSATLDTAIFPGSAKVRPLDNLVA